VSARLTSRAAPLVATLVGVALACIKDDPTGPRAIPYAVVAGSYALEGTVTEGRTGTVRGSVVIEELDMWGQFLCTTDLTIEENGAPTLTLAAAPCDGRVIEARELIFAIRPGPRPLSWRFVGGEIQGTGFSGGEHVGEEAGVTWRGSWRLTRLVDEARIDE
jgi:hypothetical protein